MAEWLKFWPVAVVAAGVVGSGSVDTFRINATAAELADISESVDENEESIEAIQRLLIERQGRQQLDLQRIETQQDQHGKALQRLEGAQNEILRLLRERRD